MTASLPIDLCLLITAFWALSWRSYLLVDVVRRSQGRLRPAARRWTNAPSLPAIAGNRAPPSKRVRELWCIIGRRGGKSRIAAALACYFALFIPHRLAGGENAKVLVLAASMDQAKVVFDYVSAFLHATPPLRKEISRTTRNEIRLKNGITIAIHANCIVRYVAGPWPPAFSMK